MGKRYHEKKPGKRNKGKNRSGTGAHRTPGHATAARGAEESDARDSSAGEGLRITLRNDPATGLWAAYCDEFPSIGWVAAGQRERASEILREQGERLFQRDLNAMAADEKEARDSRAGEEPQIVTRYDPIKARWLAYCDKAPGLGWAVEKDSEKAAAVINERAEALVRGTEPEDTEPEDTEPEDTESSETADPNEADDLLDSNPDYIPLSVHRKEIEELKEAIDLFQEEIGQISDLAVNMVRSNSRSARAWGKRIFGILDYDIEATCDEYDYLRKD